MTKELADALDRHLWPGASSIKRAEHSLDDADELRQLAVGQGFQDVIVHTVSQIPRFASPREYARLQMVATPLAALIADMENKRRDTLVDAIARDLSTALGRDDRVYPPSAEVAWPADWSGRLHVPAACNR